MSVTSKLDEKVPDGRVSLFQRIFWRSMWLIFAIFVIPLLRVSASGFRNIPKKQPCLILGNHVTYTDPFWVAFFAYRRVHFMASAHWFRLPYVGTLLTAIGAFPKAKFTKDSRAIRYLLEFYKEGEAVALFPEGERNWSGRTVPMRPGIGRLILRLGCPVVFVRITGAHLQHPRWARYPRWAPVHLEYSEPVTFTQDTTAEQLEAEIFRRLSVDPDECPTPRFSYGRNMAHGLPGYLWACPVCMQLETLEVNSRDGNQIECRACGAGWTIDISQRLFAIAGPAVDTTVTAAYDHIDAHFGPLPISDLARYAETGIVLESGPCTIVDVLTKALVARGRARLYASQLVVVDEAGSSQWEMPLDRLVAISIEARALLQLRTAENLVEFRPEGESTVKWNHFLGPYRDQAKAGEKARAG